MEEKEQLNHSTATTTKNEIREDELEKKICYITQSFSHYFKNQLQKLARKKCKKC